MRESAKYFGLTGGIASGKSTVAAMFSGLGARIIDADKIGHEFLHSASPVFPEIVSAFGPSILDRVGEIDRGLLGPMVFADPAKLQQLNAIVHPRIIERVDERARACCVQDPRAVVIVDAALIYEANIRNRFRKVIVGWCRPAQQLERLTAKSGMTREQAEQRIASQMPADEKRRLADFVIDCSGSLEETRRQVEALYPQLRQLIQTA
ncbi:MAG TPA: dephospho-CoA kinase [Terriglobia bacterium]|nr:dephospho-CoA kinase [Terriglobia bacterium]